jgi:hypothetical protein
MKKILLGALVLGFATVTSVNANPIHFSPATTVNADQDETPVKPEDLPAAVKATLATDEYKEWQILTAHLVKKDGLEVYKINLKKGEETKLVKLDKDGKPVAEKEA